MKLKFATLIIIFLYSSSVFAAAEDLPCKNTHIGSCKVACEAVRNNTINEIDPISDKITKRQSAAADCAAILTTQKKQ